MAREQAQALTELGGYSYALRIQHRTNGMNHCCNANDRENGLLGYALLSHDFLMRVDAFAAAVDRRDCNRPKLKINRIDAMRPQPVHSQLRRQSAVFLVS